MFPITVINDDVLKAQTSTQKSFKVEIKDVNDTWQDISDYVKEINIIENLQYDGNSQLNKLGIKLVNTDGEFSPSKVGAPFNQIDATSNQPWLTRKFPIKVSVVTPTDTYLIFQGYVNKVTEKDTEATFEAFDILFALSQRRLMQGFYATYVTPSEAINNLLSDIYAEWTNTFGVVNVVFFPDTQIDLINFYAEGGQTYLAALNQLCQSIGAYFTYSAINNKLYFTFPADTQFAEPSVNFTLQTADCAEYSIDAQVDRPNKVTIEADVLEPYGSKINDYWNFTAKDIDNAIRIPKNSRSDANISFSGKGYNPDLTNVWLNFQTYTILDTGTELVYQGGGGLSNWYDLTNLPLSISKHGIDITINSATVKIDGLILDITNNSADTNVAIVECKIDAYPYLEAGNLKQIYEEPDVIPIEKQIKTAYLGSGILERLAEAYLKFVRSQYLVDVKLLKFLPDLFVGGIINVTLYDTSLNNTKSIIRSVQHIIADGFYSTKLKVGTLDDITLTTTSLSEAGISRGTLAPSKYGEPIYKVTDIEETVP